MTSEQSNSRYDDSYFETAIEQLPTEYKAVVEEQPTITSYQPLNPQLPDPITRDLVTRD